VIAESEDSVLMMYPTFRYQSPGDLPTFTLMVQNRTNHDIDFSPADVHAYVDGKACYVYTLEQRVAEIRSSKLKKQIALAIVGGLAAGAAAYGASHGTATYTSYGRVGHTTFYQTATLRTYDPMAGIFAGAVVGGATAVGVRQLERSAGYEEQTAQSIFQRTTVQPGNTVVGQIMLKPQVPFSEVRLDVPFSNAQPIFVFDRKTTTAN
jgi:hypothetical protein